MKDESRFEQWAIVEVMGHQCYAGRVTEETIGGCPFVRVDVPAAERREAFTKLLGAAAIFAITPVAEEVARRVAERHAGSPVNVYGMPRPSPQRALDFDDDQGDDDGDYEC